MTKLGFISDKNRKENIKQALDLIKPEFSSSYKQAKDPLIKVNFVSDSNQLAATDHQAVAATIKVLNSICVKDIWVAEAAFGNTLKAFKNFNYSSLEEEFDNVKLIDLNTQPSTTKLGLRLSRPVLESDFRVSVSPPKTHDTVIMTAAMKNIAVGSIIIGSRTKGIHCRRNFHQGDYTKINKRLVEIYNQVKLDLAVLDGYRIMEGKGPGRGDPVESNWALAGTNAMEVDVLAAYLMGFEPGDIGYLHFSYQQGLGEIDPQKIKVAGGPVKDKRIRIKPHPTTEKQLNW